MSQVSDMSQVYESPEKNAFVRLDNVSYVEYCDIPLKPAEYKLRIFLIGGHIKEWTYSEKEKRDNVYDSMRMNF